MKVTTRHDENNEQPKLISRSRAAAMLGVCLRTVQRRERDGILTAHRISSRLTAYPESEVLQIIAESRGAINTGMVHIRGKVMA